MLKLSFQSSRVGLLQCLSVSRLQIVNLPVNEVERHAHIEVNIDLLLLVKLDGVLLVLSGLLIVDHILEELRLHGDVGEARLHLVVRKELIFLNILEQGQSKQYSEVLNTFWVVCLSPTSFVCPFY